MRSTHLDFKQQQNSPIFASLPGCAFDAPPSKRIDINFKGIYLSLLAVTARYFHIFTLARGDRDILGQFSACVIDQPTDLFQMKAMEGRCHLSSKCLGIHFSPGEAWAEKRATQFII